MDQLSESLPRLRLIWNSFAHNLFIGPRTLQKILLRGSVVIPGLVIVNV